MMEHPREQPAVAVCIPAYDEADGVAAAVASVRRAAYPQDRVEIIVAVDGADADVMAAARAAGARAEPVVPNQGSYNARNAAIAAISTPVAAVLFTDADCMATPGWIASHVAALERSPLSGGAVEFVFAGTRPTPAEWVDSIRHLTQEAYVTRDGFAVTCNLAVRREVLNALTFDGSLRSGGDADFCLRARAAGFGLAYTPDAVIRHPARPTRQALLQKVRRISSGGRRVRALQGRDDRPKVRFGFGAYRTARAAGHQVGPLWGLRACLLDYRAQRLRRATFASQMAPDPT